MSHAPTGFPPQPLDQYREIQALRHDLVNAQCAARMALDLLKERDRDETAIVKAARAFLNQTNLTNRAALRAIVEKLEAIPR